MGQELVAIKKKEQQMEISMIGTYNFILDALIYSVR